MGIQADNAHEMVVTFEALVFEFRARAKDQALSIAKLSNRPLSDHAEALAQALDDEDDEAIQKAMENIERESLKASSEAYKAVKRHRGKGDTDMGNFSKAFAKAVSARRMVFELRKYLEQAELHDLAKQGFLDLEKGLSEIDV